MKIADKNKEELLKELSVLKEQMKEMNHVRKQYENTLETLRKNEEKYEFIVNAHSEYMSLINKKYQYEAVNDSYCLAVNKSREDFIGNTVQELWGKDVFEKSIKPNMDRCFKGEIVRYETNFMVGSNQEKYYSVNYYPYRNKKGEVAQIVVVTRDITDKKLAELELIESERMLRESNRQKDEYLKIINSDLIRAGNYIFSLLPNPMRNEFVTTDWKLIPSSMLGGDAFGYFWLDKSNLALFILDVSGHGVGSALHSISALTMLRFKTLPKTNFYEPESVLTSMNNTFNMHEHDDLYFSMWYCVYNLDEKTLKFSGAGHPPIIVFNKNNKPELIESENFVIGYNTGFEFKGGKLKIGSNARLYLYSDGAYEIRKPDGTMMNVSELADYFKERDLIDGAEITGLYDHLTGITKRKLEDDFLVVKMKTHGLN